MMKFIRSITGISLIDQSLVSGVNFITGIYLAYHLGVTAFGQYSLVLLIVQFCIEIQRCVITSPMFVFAAEEGSTSYLAGLYPMQILLSILLSLATGAFIFLSGAFFEKWQISLFALPAMVFTLTRLQQEFYRRYFFAAKQQLKSLTMDGASSAILVGGLVHLACKNSIDVKSIILLSSFSCLLPLLFFKIPFDLSIRQIKEIFRKHYHFSKWLFASSLATYFSSNLLLFIGSAFLGSAAAGIMKLSQYIMGGMIILYQAMENIIPFQLAQFVHQAKIDQLKRYFLRYFQLLLLATTTHGIVIFIFMKPLLYRINDGPYTNEQYYIACGYILFSFLLSINYCLQYLLRAFRQTKPVFIAAIVSACLITLTGKPIIQSYGVTGILYGFFLSQLAIMMIYTGYVHKLFKSDQ